MVKGSRGNTYKLPHITQIKLIKYKVMVKTAIIEEEDIEITFPCLMVTDSGLVVLMTEVNDGLGRGVVIVSNGPMIEEVGYSTDTWVMEDFRPLKGKVVLENK